MRHSNLDETVNKEKLKNCSQEALVILVKTLKVLFALEKVRFEKKSSVKNVRQENLRWLYTQYCFIRNAFIRNSKYSNFE